jgi:hypothetical protein
MTDNDQTSASLLVIAAFLAAHPEAAKFPTQPALLVHAKTSAELAPWLSIVERTEVSWDDNPVAYPLHIAGHVRGLPVTVLASAVAAANTQVLDNETFIETAAS